MKVIYVVCQKMFYHFLATFSGVSTLISAGPLSHSLNFPMALFMWALFAWVIKASKLANCSIITIVSGYLESWNQSYLMFPSSLRVTSINFFSYGLAASKAPGLNFMIATTLTVSSLEMASEAKTSWFMLTLVKFSWVFVRLFPRNWSRFIKI